MRVNDKICKILCDMWVPRYVISAICELGDMSAQRYVSSKICKLNDTWARRYVSSVTVGVELAPSTPPRAWDWRRILLSSILSLSSPVWPAQIHTGIKSIIPGPILLLSSPAQSHTFVIITSTNPLAAKAPSYFRYYHQHQKHDQYHHICHQNPNLCSILFILLSPPSVWFHENMNHNSSQIPH